MTPIRIQARLRTAWRPQPRTGRLLRRREPQTPAFSRLYGLALLPASRCSTS